MHLFLSLYNYLCNNTNRKPCGIRHFGSREAYYSKLFNESSLPADATIVSAKAQAQKSTVNNTDSNQLRAKIGSGVSDRNAEPENG